MYSRKILAFYFSAIFYIYFIYTYSLLLTARKLNRQRAGDRPKHPKFLNFQVNWDHVPDKDDFLQVRLQLKLN